MRVVEVRHVDPDQPRLVAVAAEVDDVRVRRVDGRGRRRSSPLGRPSLWSGVVRRPCRWSGLARSSARPRADRGPELGSSSAVVLGQVEAVEVAVGRDDRGVEPAR